MTDRPSQDAVEIPNKPYESENGMAERAARVLKQQRKSSGGLTDDSNEGDMKVSDSKPFKNLSGH